MCRWSCVLWAGEGEVSRPCLYPRLANSESSMSSVNTVLWPALELRLDATTGLCAAIPLQDDANVDPKGGL
jgi:hypothetical protein